MSTVIMPKYDDFPPENCLLCWLYAPVGIKKADIASAFGYLWYFPPSAIWNERYICSSIITLASW